MTGCNKKTEVAQTPENPGKFVISTIEGARPNFTTYFQTLANLNLSAIESKNATELAVSSAMFGYGKSVYFTSGAPPTIRKYNLTDSGKIIAAGTLVGEGTRVFSTLCFRSETEAYATVYGQNQIIKFNPATMQKTGDIDITSLYRKNASNATMGMLMGGSLIRDDKMYIPVHYESGLAPLIDSAFIAIIDLKAGQLEKLIRDARSNSVYGNSKLVEVLAMDENKNIYIEAFGGGASNKPSGVFRIKAGEFDFDKDYFFNLNGATGNNCYGVYYFGKDMAFTARLEPFATSISGFFWKFYRMDLATKTVIGEVADVPLVNAFTTMLMRQFEKDKIVFGVQAGTENALYEFNMLTSKATRKFTSVGRIAGLENLK